MAKKDSKKEKKKDKKKRRKDVVELAEMAAAVEGAAASAAAVWEGASASRRAAAPESANLFGSAASAVPVEAQAAAREATSAVGAVSQPVAEPEPEPEPEAFASIDFSQLSIAEAKEEVQPIDFSALSISEGDGGVTRIDFSDSDDDGVTRLDFSGSSDGGVTRIDFSNPGDDGVTRLDFSNPAIVASAEPATGQVQAQPEPHPEPTAAPQPEPAVQAQPAAEIETLSSLSAEASSVQADTAVATVASGVSQPQAVASTAAELSAEERAADREQAANKPAPDEVLKAKSGLERIIDNVETVVIGKREPVSLVVLALVARGHVLLEDLPGTGKTTLVSALARSTACNFSRIQFTPDIMPSDVSGFSIFNQKTNDFEFRPGGVMSNLVLADEINRASAKTQSALLEAMEERQVTVDGETYKLPEPFMVLATQNPIEQFGTYPLPEAQLDRFIMKLSMGYPGFEQEVRVLELGDKAKKALQAVVTGPEILGLRAISQRVYASRIVLRYIVEVITATRDNPEVQVGSSPRGGIALLSLARAYALLQGRAYVVPDDVKYLAPHVLCHRISLAHEAKVSGRTERQVVESILSGIAVPYYDEDEVKGLKL